MNELKFYSDLQTFAEFVESTDINYYYDVPDEWCVIVSDVIDSTKELENGRYREVNLVGASVIIAISNEIDTFLFPYVFGGDGATILLPKVLFQQIEPVLNGLVRYSKDSLNLNLRIGKVDVDEIYKAGYDLKVSCYSPNQNLIQSMLIGDGYSYAESLIKNQFERYSIKSNETKNPSFVGLECRWEDIPSPKDEVVSLLVASRSKKTEEQLIDYKIIIDKINEIYGDEDMYKPLEKNALNLTMDSKVLNLETKLKNGTDQVTFKQKIDPLIVNTIGKISFFSGAKVLGFDGEVYKETLLTTTDFQKFEGILKMIITGSKSQTQELKDFLESLYQKKRIFYGTFLSSHAHLTCLVFDRVGPQIHFIDGVGGGYTMASKQLKDQINSKI
jgi:hypothetical protein